MSPIEWPSSFGAHWAPIVDRIHTVDSEAAVVRLVDELASSKTTRILAFVNAHAMNSVVTDPAFRAALLDADVLLRDGSGMALLYRLQGRQPGLNLNGTDFIPRLLSVFRGRRIALWGTSEPYLSTAAIHCELEFGVRVVSCEDGFQSPALYCERAELLQPELIVLGMGMPKQERVASALRAVVAGGALIVCGGAIIDFLGGKVGRAPEWVRRFGMEWAYRLVLEPRRLFLRYVVGNPVFVLRAWRCRGSSLR